MTWAKQKGFTIVELLIVVVVIAILAAITIVAYNGITQQARTSAISNSLSQVAKKLESERTINGGALYPSDLSGITATLPEGVTLDYSVDNSGVKGSFCLTALSDTDAFHIGRDGAVNPGSCEDHYGLAVHLPLNGGSVVDVAGSNVSFTTNNLIATTGQNGQADGALNFSSASQSSAIADKNLMKPPFSLSVWVRTDTLGQLGHILYGTTTPGDGYGGERETHVTLDTSNRYVFVGAGCFSVRAGTLDDAGWHHIAFTVNTGGDIRAYMDGTTGTSNIGMNCLDNYDAYMPSFWIGRPATSSRFFTGDIDDVRVYNRVLSASEIGRLFTKGAE